MGSGEVELAYQAEPEPDISELLAAFEEERDAEKRYGLATRLREMVLEIKRVREAAKRQLGKMCDAALARRMYDLEHALEQSERLCEQTVEIAGPALTGLDMYLHMVEYGRTRRSCSCGGHTPVEERQITAIHLENADFVMERLRELVEILDERLPILEYAGL